MNVLAALLRDNALLRQALLTASEAPSMVAADSAYDSGAAQTPASLVQKLFEADAVRGRFTPRLAYHPAVESAYLPSLTEAEWNERWEALVAQNPPLDVREAQIDRWVSAVTAGERVYLIPDDDLSPDGDIQLFSAM